MTSDVAATRPPLLALTDKATSSRLIKQGAEAKVYIATVFPVPVRTSMPTTSFSSLSASAIPQQVLLKYRFSKQYRHPSLSAHLTATRTTAEARALVRCMRAGVNTPRILCIDEEEGVLGLEVVDGYSVRELLGGGSEGDETDDVMGSNIERSPPPALLSSEETNDVMQLIGVQLARMHQAHIIHGDLTTSNMMVRRRRNRREDGRGGSLSLVMIDFGLSANSTSSEDKAVDMYVLQRAFASTHPRSDHLFDEILRVYAATLESEPATYDPKVKAEKGTGTGLTSCRDIMRKLDEVRLRGRKRSMVG